MFRVVALHCDEGLLCLKFCEKKWAVLAVLKPWGIEFRTTSDKSQLLVHVHVVAGWKIAVHLWIMSSVLTTAWQTLIIAQFII